MKKHSEEVFYADSSIVQVDTKLIEELGVVARVSPRRRARLCAHKSPADRLHEMLIVLDQDTYIHPHKHANKPESFHVIEGTAIIIFFEDSGVLADVFEVGDYASRKTFYFRNDDARFHTQIITSDRLVFHETTTGPFRREDTIFAPWAPPESDADGARAFRARLLREAMARLEP